MARVGDSHDPLVVKLPTSSPFGPRCVVSLDFDKRVSATPESRAPGFCGRKTTYPASGPRGENVSCPQVVWATVCSIIVRRWHSLSSSVNKFSFQSLHLPPKTTSFGSFLSKAYADTCQVLDPPCLTWPKPQCSTLGIHMDANFAGTTLPWCLQ